MKLHDSRTEQRAPDQGAARPVKQRAHQRFWKRELQAISDEHNARHRVTFEGAYVLLDMVAQ